MGTLSDWARQELKDMRSVAPWIDQHIERYCVATPQMIVEDIRRAVAELDEYIYTIQCESKKNVPRAYRLIKLDLLSTLIAERKELQSDLRKAMDKMFAPPKEEDDGFKKSLFD